VPVRQRRQGCVLAMPALFCRAISFESIPESGVFRQITTAKTHSAGKVKKTFGVVIYRPTGVS